MAAEEVVDEEDVFCRLRKTRERITRRHSASACEGAQRTSTNSGNSGSSLVHQITLSNKSMANDIEIPDLFKSDSEDDDTPLWDVRSQPMRIGLNRLTSTDKPALIHKESHSFTKQSRESNSWTEIMHENSKTQPYRTHTQTEIIREVGEDTVTHEDTEEGSSTTGMKASHAVEIFSEHDPAAYDEYCSGADSHGVLSDVSSNKRFPHIFTPDREANDFRKVKVPRFSEVLHTESIIHIQGLYPPLIIFQILALDEKKKAKNRNDHYRMLLPQMYGNQNEVVLSCRKKSNKNVFRFSTDEQLLTKQNNQNYAGKMVYTITDTCDETIEIEMPESISDARKQKVSQLELRQMIANAENEGETSKESSTSKASHGTANDNDAGGKGVLMRELAQERITFDVYSKNKRHLATILISGANIFVRLSDIIRNLKDRGNTLVGRVLDVTSQSPLQRQTIATDSTDTPETEKQTLQQDTPIIQLFLEETGRMVLELKQFHGKQSLTNKNRNLLISDNCSKGRNLLVDFDYPLTCFLAFAIISSVIARKDLIQKYRHKQSQCCPLFSCAT